MLLMNLINKNTIMPGKKITKPHSVVKNEDFTWDRFTKDCANSRYVLVLGNEAILNKERNIEAKGDSLSLLFNATITYLEDNGISIMSKNFTQLGCNINKLRDKVIETVDEFDFYDGFDEEIEPTLFQLLSTKCFRMVLTTTIDPYVEIAMEKVWGKGGFRVLSIYGDEGLRDISPNDSKFSEFDEIQPTLFYVFGKADVKRPTKENPFVLTENDAMSVIHKWFSTKGPKELLKYIQTEGMKILSVGCKFDDWLFRFFWFILRGNIDNLSSGQVAVEFTKEDEKLRHYLEQQNVKLFPDARLFMKEAADKLLEAMDMGKLPKKGDGIFISYAHEDKYIALPLYYRLCEQGYNVWIDEKLEPSEKYDKRITNAINSCKIFMPILSSQVIADLKQDEFRYYRTEEWRQAQIRYNDEKDFDGGIKVLPFVIGQYQVKSDYHQKTPECIVKATAYEVARGSFAELNKLIYDKLQNRQ